MNIFSIFGNYIYRFVILVVMCTLLYSCGTVPGDYKSTTPEFDMALFFNGKLKAYGMVQDRSGKVIRRFHADLTGTWQGDKGRLEEDFWYDDGATQKRVWNLTKHPDNHYSGTADDVVGVATGHSQGFAFNWHYTLTIDVNDTAWDISLDDWMYQLNESRIINRTSMTKWGFKVGEITLIIEKL
ncbi:MAG: DUF3833 domain-containing protein [Gammaproteobacteria bacterium]|nr:DUF3833 domain-containing protein [Gammaproteobacteria bacterium]